MASEKKSEAKSNGRKFRKVERKRFRWWKSDDDSTPITGKLGAREEKATRFGVQAFYPLQVTEDGSDRKGAYKVGDTIAIAEKAVLRQLLEFVGSEVRITPAGLDGRVRLFDIEVAE